MTDAQMSCPFQAIIIYQSLLLMQCPAVLQQDVVIPAEKEQQLLLQLIQDLLTLEPENSCLLLISELQRERQESSDRKWHVLELQCLRQIELFKNNLSVQELMLDIKKEEKLYHAAAKKFQQLESKNVSERNSYCIDACTFTPFCYFFPCYVHNKTLSADVLTANGVRFMMQHNVPRQLLRCQF